MCRGYGEGYPFALPEDRLYNKDVGDVHAAIEQDDRDTRAAQGDLVLAVRVTSDAKRARAEAILRAAGATGVEAVR